MAVRKRLWAAKVALVIVVLCWMVSSATRSYGNSAGITGLTTSPTGCNQCHSGGQVPTVTLTGPTTVSPGETHEYVLEITPIGSQIWGGLNAGASGGTLATGGSHSAFTQLLSGEITHTQRKGGDGNPIRFSFLWTAPAAPGNYTIRSWGNAVNGNGANTGDRASFASLTISSGQTPTPTITPTPTATPTATIPSHDVVLLPIAPRAVQMPKTATTIVTKKFKLKVLNADPKGTSPQTVSLTLVSTDCPTAVSFGTPDFDPKLPFEQDQVSLAPGASKAASIQVAADPTQLTSKQPKLPIRCFAVFQASTVLPGNVDPSPSNNVFEVQLDLFDLSDPPQATPGEAWVKRAPFTRITIPKGDGSKTVRRPIVIANGDASAAQNLGLSVDASTCSWILGTTVDLDPSTPAPDPTRSVPPGKTAKALLEIVASAGAATTTNPKAPERCFLDVIVQGSASPDPEPSNDKVRMPVDLIDKNDF